MASVTPRGRQSWLTRWFMNLPTWFDRLFPRAGKWQLFWIVMLLLLLSVPLIITPLDLWKQITVAVVLVIVGWLTVKIESRQSQNRSSEYLHVFLAWLSIVTTLRYLYYRTNFTLALDSWVNGFFSILLYAAELYAIATLLLSYFQTLRLRERRPLDLATIPHEELFSVDVYIPTFNEDVAIVRKTVLASLAMDYPEDRKKIYVLDDGRDPKYRDRREQLRQMCAELGCILMTRDNNEHAKAGNINAALRRTDGDLILILDCDHIPSRQFLQETVGFFYKSEKVAMVQTPHWFYNPDPFERNLLTRGRVPVTSELFYKVIQKGNDFWNAAFFCGSAAVIRRDYVLEVGGIATGTVTEDCHTSLRLHGKGYESVYYDKIMVAGLAPETYPSYVKQQARWARGMAQILRIENPLFNRKLKLTTPQRLCYFSASSHFFFGFPRIMYALAPILFLLFNINIVRGLGVETLAYAVPHILLGMNANYITNKTARFSFWNEIFEYAMAFQDGIVTFLAVINPKLGKFDVTDKDLRSITRRSFDWGPTRVSLILTILLIVSLIAVPFWLLLRPEVTEAVLINGLWAIFNLIFLSGALLVAFEQPQLRRAHRLSRNLDVTVFGGDMPRRGRTQNISENGAQIILGTSNLNLPDQVEIEVVGDFDARATVTGRVTRLESAGQDQVMLSVTFVNVSQAQMDDLVLVLYSDVRQWYSQQRQEVDRPFESLRFLAAGVLRAFRDPRPADSIRARS
ncbi:MAG: UDP-forming cellulose synthase catalytic subunit [Oculatellaceae cyanobacterium Prado106]|jgi:cellulose synthase (UDP-forming)|nr:UDP-forming cellulose synthase catalytic subunit [Oculatellaceae cyanobacterium Prado106]